VDFDLTVGRPVPRSVHFVPMPQAIFAIEPAWRGYDYFMVGDQCNRRPGDARNRGDIGRLSLVTKPAGRMNSGPLSFARDGSELKMKRWPFRRKKRPACARGWRAPLRLKSPSGDFIKDCIAFAT
jgi:hypothetical protein